MKARLSTRLVKRNWSFLSRQVARNTVYFRHLNLKYVSFLSNIILHHVVLTDVDTLKNINITFYLLMHKCSKIHVCGASCKTPRSRDALINIKTFIFHICMEEVSKNVTCILVLCIYFSLNYFYNITTKKS